MFKNIIRKILDIPYKYSNLKKESVERQKEVLWKQKESNSLQRLLQLLGNQYYLPFTDMALCPAAICHVLNDIQLNTKRTVIEFGAGNSTVLIAKMISGLKRPCVFYSVEFDAAWIKIVEEQLAGFGLKEYVHFIHAPLQETNKFATSLAEQFRWFDTQIIMEEIENHLFDLVLVDAPIGKLCPYSRFPAIPFLKNNLSESFSIFLDDVGRPQEREIFEAWIRLLGDVDHQRNSRYGVLLRGKHFISSPQ